jgi:hypothetical protein
MFDTAGQSRQALLFCLRYDFPTEWSVFMNRGTNATFQVVLEKTGLNDVRRRSRSEFPSSVAAKGNEAL